MPNEYEYEIRRQIIIESIREALVSLLMRAASDGYGMGNRQELEELAEFLAEETVRRAEEKTIMKTTICENCAYYDERKDEQPCCACVEGCNFEEGGEKE